MYYTHIEGILRLFTKSVFCFTVHLYSMLSYAEIRSNCITKTGLSSLYDFFLFVISYWLKMQLEEGEEIIHNLHAKEQKLP